MVNFEEINSLQEWDNVLDESSRRPIVLFKHSTACPVSARAWKEVQAFIRENADEVLVAIVKVIESRPVSNQVTEDLGIKHESPQVMLLRDRQVSWHTSHNAVTQDQIKKALEA
ncbi:MAG: bacillithiol system redox-active protein YtxJ [Desulfitobacteriaceae bacterium]